mmetsp:Transcript_55909/g.131099  ORF Transcript_55909/g.131099 Transcript_55909/m.131099 type:complete len:222 (-) Transcript_55909:56-721(-)
MTKAEQKKAVQFTRMCKFWLTNECKMGADCTFAHSTAELRPSPKPCFDFVKNGFCSRGEACRFVHQLTDKKAKAKFMQMQQATSPPLQPYTDFRFQPYPDQSQLSYAGYMGNLMNVQSPMSSGGLQPFPPQYTHLPWSPESDANLGGCVRSKPRLDDIPVPMSLIGDAGHETGKLDKAEPHRTSLGEAWLEGAELVPAAASERDVLAGIGDLDGPCGRLFL